MPIFRCAECGNTIEEDAPPKKCECGAEFSYDEVYDFEESSEKDDDDDLEEDFESDEDDDEEF